LKSDDEEDDRLNGHHTKANKEQEAAATQENSHGISARARRTASTKVVQNGHSSYQVNGSRRNGAESGGKSEVTDVQGSAPLSDEDSVVLRGKRQKTSKK